MISLFKKVVSLIITSTVLISSIFAGERRASMTKVYAAEAEACTSVQDGYAITVSVLSECETCKNVGVEIKNTGEASITDWSASFSFDGEIQTIWNAVLLNKSEHLYEVKNADWNRSIHPGEAVSFGMTVVSGGSDSLPANITLKKNTKNKGEKTPSDFSVEYICYSDWESGCNGVLILKNLTNHAIADWELSFDYGREIYSVSNAILKDCIDEKYVIHSEEYNAILAEGESIYIGFVAGSGNQSDEPENFSLRCVCDENGNDIGSSDEETEKEEVIFLLTGAYISSERAIDMYWYLEKDISSVSIYKSYDGVSYSKEADINNDNEYRYKTEDYDTIYFKAFSFDESGRKFETLPVIARKTEDGFVVEMVDSDNDGVADAFEVIAGTNQNMSDTDEDGLSDYEELYVTYTVPTEYSSVQEGVSDAEADSDSDGLSNRFEIENGTNPNDKDTDLDGVNDYDEIFIYGTDPLQVDTDDDTLWDGEEIKIGLNPLNAKTFGVPDAEYVSEQLISEKSEALADINKKESAYQLSVMVTGRGSMERNIRVKDSDYLLAIQNECMVGTAPKLSFEEEIEPEEIKLMFRMNDDVINDSIGVFDEIEELQGIKRFNVFRFFEELNMLLPIETGYDEENNLIYATTDQPGTYCVMDVERWLYNFDVPEDAFSNCNDEVSLMSLMDDMVGMDSPMHFSLAANSETVSGQDKEPLKKTPVDIVFMLQKSGWEPEIFEGQKKLIGDVLESMSREYGIGNLRIAVLLYDLENSFFLTAPEGGIWFSKAYGLRKELKRVEYDEVEEFTDRGEAFEKVQNEVEYRFNSAKFIYQMMNGPTRVGSKYFNQMSECGASSVIYSEISPFGYGYADENYVKKVSEAITATKGIELVFGTETQSDIYYHIVGQAAKPQMLFDAIVPTGWKHVELEGILDPIQGADTDKDGIPDWDEVDTKRLSWKTNGEVVLPTIQECINMTNNPYAVDGLKRIRESKSFPGNPTDSFMQYFDYVLNHYRILPIVSDPTNPDSDGDGYEDEKDPRPMLSDVQEIRIKNLDYVCIEEETNHFSYGGNQGWFSGKIFWGDGEVIKNYGCGTIAASDLLLYLSLQSPLYKTEYTDMAYGVPIKKENYMSYVYAINDTYTKTGLLLGVLGPNLSLGLNYYFSSNNIPLSAKWRIFLSGNDLKKEIIEQIRRDIPVIFSVGPNTSNIFQKREVTLYSRIEKTDERYDNNKNELYQYNKESAINGHYMMITSVVEDKIANKTMLCISSWGKKYYIDFEEYLSYIEEVGDGISSSIMYVRGK